jgi:hypothetical protein
MLVAADRASGSGAAQPKSKRIQDVMTHLFVRYENRRQAYALYNRDI